MSMSKRFQIPITSEVQKLYQSAARKRGLSAAEWARRILEREARKEISTGETLGDVLQSLNREFGEFPDLDLPEREPPREIEDWTK